MFNLETALATWRRQLEHRRVFLREDLDELERHLRDRVADLVHEGTPAAAAFDVAVHELGDFDGAEDEYRKVYWGKLRLRSTPFKEIAWRLAMLRNYLKIALRNLRKQPGYSLINIGGLGLGLACAFMIVLYVQHERSFDQFHEHKDRLYRMYWHAVQGENAGAKSAIFAAGHAALIQERIPEVEAIIRFDDRSPYLRVGEEVIAAQDFAFMDKEVLEAFTFPLVRGNPETALEDPYSLVLTESAAQALFGGEDPLGKTVSYDSRFDMTVTGVMEDVPPNSHLQFSYLAPFTLMREVMGPDALENFSNSNYFFYFLLKPGTSAEQVEAKLHAYLRERNPDSDTVDDVRLELQPIADVHFTTDIQWDVASNVDPQYIYMFSGIALLILLIACVNFMNLATARAAKRAKEVGVRKVMGAQRGQLVWQFLGESVMLSVVGLLLALLLTVLFLPTFRDIIGAEVTFDLANAGMVALLVGMGLLAGVVAGSYPAFYLSAFRPAHVLKGEATRSNRAALLRRGLIVFQFAISVFLIIGTITIFKQLDYMKTQRLGFQKEQVVFAPMVGDISKSYDAFRQTLLENPRVLSVARAASLPGRVNTNRGYNWPGAEGQDEQGKGFYTIVADPDYVETLDLTLLAGRDFSWDVPTDTNDTYVVNEAALRELGIEDARAAIGQPFRAWDRPMGTIVGVVEDFHFKSLHQEIEPIVINYKPNWLWMVAVRVAPEEVPATMSFLQEQWRAFAPGFPFDYNFLDEDFDRLYRTEEDLGQLFGFFAFIAIFVACLGLFGLASYSAEQRTKEIGVRKVLGATVPQIVVLLSKEFTRLVLVAFVLAAPLAYYAMTRWLENFAYRTTPGVETFVLAAALAFLIALLTVSYQAIKAANANPTRALRYE